jgi:hypothetical protein
MRVAVRYLAAMGYQRVPVMKLREGRARGHFRCACADCASSSRPVCIEPGDAYVIDEEPDEFYRRRRIQWHRLRRLPYHTELPRYVPQHAPYWVDE